MRVLAIAAAVLVLARTASAEVRVYSTTIKGDTKLQSSEYLEESVGGSPRITEKGEDGIVTTQLAADGTVAWTEIRMKQGSVRMASEGGYVVTSGTWDGKEVAGRCELKGLGFYGSGFTFALRALALSGAKSLKFPMIGFADPSKATVMELKRDGGDSFKGRKAVKVKISLTGILAGLWSARMLIGEDGTFFRYEGSQGPGTPNVITELVE